MKNKSYIKAIKILALADIQSGKRKLLENDIKKLIKEEDYETCQGIIEALRYYDTEIFESLKFTKK